MKGINRRNLPESSQFGELVITAKSVRLSTKFVGELRQIFFSFQRSVVCIHDWLFYFRPLVFDFGSLRFLKRLLSNSRKTRYKKLHPLLCRISKMIDSPKMDIIHSIISLRSIRQPDFDTTNIKKCSWLFVDPSKIDESTCDPIFAKS